MAFLRRYPTRNAFAALVGADRDELRGTDPLHHLAFGHFERKAARLQRQAGL